MFAWKVDVGMWPSGGVENIKDLKVTDYNVPFVIPTGDINSYGGYNSDDLGDSGLYDAAQSILGTSVNALYALGRTYDDLEKYNKFIASFNRLTTIFPSISMAYPNLWNSIINDTQVVRSTLGFYHFKSINRVLVRGDSVPETAVYKVESDGSLSKLGSYILNASGGLGNIINGSTVFTYFSYFDSTKELTYENLISYENYKVVFINTWSDGKVWFVVDQNPNPVGNAHRMAELLFSDNTIDPDFSFTDDPYVPGGNSSSGGGGGDFDNTSVPIDVPQLPSISASSTGFISLFNPTLVQLNDLASYMWSDLFEIDGWKKLFADPMDAILGLSILPVSIPTSGAREVKIGNIGTGISLNVASTQFVELNCGSIDVNEYWGAYLDYEPYTKAQIFLPYIGTRPISVDEIMGKTVSVSYHVDILTGACCCFVKCGNSVLYTYNGQCSIPIPVNSANYTSVVNGVISIAASVGSLVASGGASAPTVIPAIASSAVNQMKPQIEKSGAISGSAGILNMQTPYLILIRPRQALPSKQNEFIGYPSLITVQLSELIGYTEVQSIHLENIPATQEELAEIQSLLEGGVIF